MRRQRPVRDQSNSFEDMNAGWREGSDLWIFAYGSLIWKPDFEFLEKRLAVAHGWHRALKMWSYIDRGSRDQPGLIFGMLPGGTCKGIAFKVAQENGRELLGKLWAREMKLNAYHPKWLQCQTEKGSVTALAFTLSKQSPVYTGPLDAATYRQIFSTAIGTSGTTRDYARRTFQELRSNGIHDGSLKKLLAQADPNEYADVALKMLRPHIEK